MMKFNLFTLIYRKAGPLAIPFLRTTFMKFSFLFRLVLLLDCVESSFCAHIYKRLYNTTQINK